MLKHNSRWLFSCFALVFFISLYSSHTTAFSQTRRIDKEITEKSLQSDFTIRYEAVRENNNSPKYLNDMLDANVVGIRLAVKKGKISQKQAEQEILAMRKSILNGFPPKRYQITISKQKGMLICINSNNPQPIKLFYDGKKTYVFRDNKHMEVEPGLNTSSVDLPLPGIGIDGIPLIKHLDSEFKGEIYTDFANRTLYLPGKLNEFNPGSDMKVTLQTTSVDGLHETWDYSRYKSLGAEKIASKISKLVTANHAKGEKLTMLTKTNYSLIDVSLTPVAAEKFDFYKLLKRDPYVLPRDAISIEWNDGTNNFVFVYQQNKSLEEQVAETIANNTSIKKTSKTGKIDPLNYVGLLLLAGIVGFAGWRVFHYLKISRSK